MRVEEERAIRILNHQRAWEYMKDCLFKRIPLNEDLIIKAHELMLDGLAKYSGIYRTNDERPIFIKGTNYEPPDGRMVPALMKHYWEDFEVKKSLLGMPEVGMSTFEFAAYVHAEFECIHPFKDGNGRTGRFIMNYVLCEKGYLPINIIRERENEYFACLEAYHGNNRIANLPRDCSRLAKFIYEEEYEMLQAAEKAPEIALQRYLQYDREI